MSHFRLLNFLTSLGLILAIAGCKSSDSSSSDPDAASQEPVTVDDGGGDGTSGDGPDAPTCGDIGQACCVRGTGATATKTCTAMGAKCASNVCVVCGGMDQMCCPVTGGSGLGLSCDMGLGCS